MVSVTEHQHAPDGFTLMASTEAFEVWEDFRTVTGSVLVLGADGSRREFTKTAEPTWAEGELYRGHPLDEVQASHVDLLGREFLAEDADPEYAAVAAALAPITLNGTGTYTFVATGHSPDKVGIEYGGKTAYFDPAAHLPQIAELRAAGRVMDGLIGGYPAGAAGSYTRRGMDRRAPRAWCEFVVFASLRPPENRQVQPTWYRVLRVVDGVPTEIGYFDTYEPYPPRDGSADPAAFYRELLDLADQTAASLEAAMQVTLPDARLADLARHSLVRAAITRIDGYPKYGVMDRLYGGTEHDGFQDTLNADLIAAVEWGLLDRARDILDNYLGEFVRDDGSILYRGVELGQYGRMLTSIAQYLRSSGDHDLAVRHRSKLDGLVAFLSGLQDDAGGLPDADPAHGMIVGWCEADSCLELHPDRYRLPYTSNSAEIARGFLDLGAALGDAELVERGRLLSADLQVALERGIMREFDPPYLPVIAGLTEPFHVAVARDDHDPQFRAYRANMELLFSGMLTAEQVDLIVTYRGAHRDLVLGTPLAYGYTLGPDRSTPEFATFLSYGHAYGLLQHDRRREFLLELWTLAAHAYTRGSWTAPETRRIDPALPTAGYAVPAQLSVPMLVKWMLVLEHPFDDVLWLGRGVPDAWLDEGFEVRNAPTRWGPVSYRVEGGTFTVEAPQGVEVITR